MTRLGGIVEADNGDVAPGHEFVLMASIAPIATTLKQTTAVGRFSTDKSQLMARKPSKSVMPWLIRAGSIDRSGRSWRG